MNWTPIIVAIVVLAVTVTVTTVGFVKTEPADLERAAETTITPDSYYPLGYLGVGLLTAGFALWYLPQFGLASRFRNGGDGDES